MPGSLQEAWLGVSQGEHFESEAKGGNLSLCFSLSLSISPCFKHFTLNIETKIFFVGLFVCSLSYLNNYFVWDSLSFPYPCLVIWCYFHQVSVTNASSVAFVSFTASSPSDVSFTLRFTSCLRAIVLRYSFQPFVPLFRFVCFYSDLLRVNISSSNVSSLLTIFPKAFLIYFSISISMFLLTFSIWNFDIFLVTILSS